MSAQRIAGRYEIVRLLGEGPLGKAYEASDHRREGLRVTLKILRAEVLDEKALDRRRPDLELRLKALRHAGINPLEDVGETPLGLVFLASGYTEAENLRTLLARRGPLPDARVLALARGLLQALAAAHVAGLAHGDLHPGNVLLKSRAPSTPEDPFGTAVLLSDLAQLELVGATRPAVYAAYAAPELGAETHSTAVADVFATGKILLELATGRTDSDPALLTPTLGPLLARALAADPKDRYPDALAFLEALPKAPLPTETGAALATARGLLEASEGARAAAEKRLSDLERTHAHSLSTSFARLAQRDELLAELRQAVAMREEELAGARLGGPGAEEAELSSARDELAQRAQREEALRSELQSLRQAATARRVSPALAGVLIALALALPVVWWVGRASTTEAASPTDAALLEQTRAEELAREREDTQNQLAQKDAELQAAARELETWKGSEREWREATASLTAERDEARAATEAEKRAAQAREAELTEARGHLAASESALSRARDPNLNALDQLDRVLAALAESDGRAARARYTALTITHPDLEALPGLERLTAVALALVEAREATDVLQGVERLREADRALEAARAEDAVPALAQAQWVRQESNVRGERVTAAFAALEQQTAEAKASFSSRLETRWRTLLSESPDTDPREVLAIIDWFGDGRQAAFLGWFASYLRGAAERDGALELSELLRLRYLEAWGDALAARPELASLTSAREVLLFRYARAWKNSPATEDKPNLPVVFQTPEGERPESGWRAELALRSAVVDDGSTCPGGVGGRFLFRTQAELEGSPAVVWQLDEVVEAGAASWVVRRRFYREDGSFLSESKVHIERRGKQFFEEHRPGGPLFDAASERAQRGTFEPGPDVPPPSELVDPAEWLAFRKALAAAPAEVLRYEGSSGTIWYSPIWGVLAVEAPKSFRRELAYAAPVKP